MNFEMYASKALLTRYLNQYLDEIERIQKGRENKDSRKISTCFWNEDILEIVYAHWLFHELEDGKTEEEAHQKAYEEAGSTSKIVEKLNESLQRPDEPYTEEELNHIYWYCQIDKEKGYMDVALKRFFFSLYGTTDANKIMEQFEKEKVYCPNDWNYVRTLKDVLNKKFETKEEAYGVLKKHLKEVEDYFDYCFIDCAPSINCISYNAFVAADEVIIPVTPTYPAFRGLNTLSETLDMVTGGHEWHGESFPALNPNLKVKGLIISMYQHTTVVDKQMTQMYYDMVQYPVLGEVKKESVVEQDVVFHTAVAQKHPSKQCSRELYAIAEKL